MQIYTSAQRYGGVELYLHAFLTLALDVGDWSALRLGFFTAGERSRGIILGGPDLPRIEPRFLGCTSRSLILGLQPIPVTSCRSLHCLHLGMRLYMLAVSVGTSYQ
jgi:hypothetical protein